MTVLGEHELKRGAGAAAGGAEEHPGIPQALDELGHVLGLGFVVCEQRAVHVAGDEPDGAQLGVLGKVDKRGRHAVPFVCGVPAAGYGVRGKLAAPDSTMF